MKRSWLILALTFASLAQAQMDSYLGPGVLSRGVGNVGAHAGQQADMRIVASVSGFSDNGLLPLSVGADGKIPDYKNLYGVEARFGAYGVHQFKRSAVGLEYQGTYRYYTENTGLNGSDQALTLGYTVQKSRHMVIDMRGSAGEFSFGNNGFYGYNIESFDPSTSVLFDNRSIYVQGSMDFTYVKSPRTYFQAGGYGFKVDRRAKALIGVNGYSLRGSINHRQSQRTTYGVTFDHTHYDYPRAFGETDINSYQVYIARGLGKYWSINVAGGVYMLEAQGLAVVTLDPAVSAILGVTTGVQAFYRQNILPAGKISIARNFKSAAFTAEYGRTILPGNGVYLTTRTQGGHATLSYTGIRKWSFALNGGYEANTSVGQSIVPYKSVTGGGGVIYSLARSLYITARYDARQLQTDATNGFNRVSYRATIGLSYSGGDIPISLW